MPMSGAPEELGTGHRVPSEEGKSSKPSSISGPEPEGQSKANTPTKSSNGDTKDKGQDVDGEKSKTHNPFPGEPFASESPFASVEQREQQARDEAPPPQPANPLP